MPQLTVLMPVYNSGKFLPEAIESILNQTFREFEFLIIDDGSTDNSAAIVQSYQDPRIRFHQNKRNLGITPTLNKGIDLAAAEFIARMDADDISYPDRLEKQLQYLQSHQDCAFVSSLARVVTEDGQLLFTDSFKSEHYYYNLTFFSWIYHPTVMYRKKAVEEVGKYTAEFAEDYELLWQLSRRYKFYNLPEMLLDYRETGQSLHQVLKKQEYKKAQKQQQLRNLQHFAGDGYTLPDSYLECFRHNFQPLLEEGTVAGIVSCIRELDFITERILATDNVNRDASAIKNAARHKRDYILSFYTRHLPFRKTMLLLLRTLSLRGMLRHLKYYLLRRPHYMR